MHPDSTSGTPTNSMIQVSITIIVCPVKIDEIMHCFDLFEPFKRMILEPKSITGNLDEGKSISEAIEKIKKGLESNGEYKVLAIFDPLLLEGAWCDREVILVSNGSEWGKFADLLKGLGYKGPLPKQYTNEVLT